MKNIIFISVAVLAMFSCTCRANPVTSVSYASSENKELGFSDFINLELLEKSGYNKIYVDKNTGVLYYNKNSSPNFSVL